MLQSPLAEYSGRSAHRDFLEFHGLSFCTCALQSSAPLAGILHLKALEYTLFVQIQILFTAFKMGVFTERTTAQPIVFYFEPGLALVRVLQNLVRIQKNKNKKTSTY